MYCKKCGSEIKQTAKFCPKCGAPVSAAANEKKVTGTRTVIKKSTVNPRQMTIIAAAAAVLIIFVGLIAFRGKKKDNPANTTESVASIEVENQTQDQTASNIEVTAGNETVAEVYDGSSNESNYEEQTADKNRFFNFGRTRSRDEEMDRMGFMDDLIWIATFDERYVETYCLVNTDGEILYEHLNSNEGEAFRIGKLNQIEGGMTYFEICTYDSNNDVKDEIDVILNSQGEEIVRFTSTETDRYNILGYGDGKFLIQHRVMNMDNYATYLFTIDKDAQNSSDEMHIDDMIVNGSFDSAVYLGENIFWLKLGYNSLSDESDTACFYNTETNAYIKEDSYYEFGQEIAFFSSLYQRESNGTLEFEDGKLFLGINSSYDTGNTELCYVTADEFRDTNYKKVFDIKKVKLENYYDECYLESAKDGYFLLKTWREDYYTEDDGGHYALFDWEGKEIKSEYIEDKEKNSQLNIEGVILLEDGIRLYQFRGADSKEYYAFLNNNGELLHDEYSADDFGDYGVYLNEESWLEKDGYIYYCDKGNEEESLLIFADGSIHKINENDLSELKDLTIGRIGDNRRIVYLENHYSNIISTLKDMTSIEIHRTDNTKSFQKDDTEHEYVGNVKENVSEEESERDFEQNRSIQDQLNRGINQDVQEDVGIIFEQDGVTLQYVSDSQLELINENPDNLRASAGILHVYYNGLVLSSSENTKITEARAGERTTINIPDHDEYSNYMHSLSAELADIPIGIICYQFYVQIGSESNPIVETKMIHTDAYDEELLQNAFYSNPVNMNEENEDEDLRFYRLPVENGAAVLIQNISDSNDYQINDDAIYLNHKYEQLYTYEYGEKFIPAGQSVILHYEDIMDAAEYRKEYEISNDTELHLLFSANISNSEIDSEGQTYQVDIGVLE